uniref:RING-type domain-containing protein n=1 Tax=Ornithorhynchus anatinus TaxID=9258 RepID=A0A6I8MZE9_ORNAN
MEMRLAALQEELTCSVCMEYFIDPVTITCGHSFCQICLLRYLEDQMSYSCPECRGACELSDFLWGKHFIPRLQLHYLAKQCGFQHSSLWAISR